MFKGVVRNFWGKKSSLLYFYISLPQRVFNFALVHIYQCPWSESFIVIDVLSNSQTARRALLLKLNIIAVLWDLKSACVVEAEHQQIDNTSHRRRICPPCWEKLKRERWQMSVGGTHRSCGSPGRICEPSEFTVNVWPVGATMTASAWKEGMNLPVVINQCDDTCLITFKSTVSI